MVIVIEAQTVNELFIKVSRKLILQGKTIAPRDLGTIELEQVFLILKDPTCAVVTLPERNTNLNYLNGEMKWYLSGSLNIEDINKFSTFWDTLADTNGTVNSNYGFLALKEKWSGKSQFEWCISRLKKDINSRQAVINYNQPRHKYEHVKDFVCTLAQQFIVRDNKLDCIVWMRSNDFIFGLTYDLPWFTYLQKVIAKELNIEIGTYTHFATSLHVYERHFKMIENIANAKIGDE